MKHKVSELEGTLLDAAVALADGRLVVKDEPRWPKGDYAKLRQEFGGRHVVRWYSEATGELGGWEPMESQGSPSTEWDVAGPIIDRERIGVDPINETGSWCAYVVTGPGDDMVLGATPLIAAMRAYVASKFGDEVELP